MKGERNQDAIIFTGTDVILTEVASLEVAGAHQRQPQAIICKCPAGPVPLPLAALGAALDGDTLLAPVSFWVGFWLGLGLSSRWRVTSQ